MRYGNHQTSNFFMPTYRFAGISSLIAATEHDRLMTAEVRHSRLLPGTNSTQTKLEISAQLIKCPHDFFKRTEPRLQSYPINLLH